MEDAFYRPTGDPSRFESTPHTQGPWGAGLQHAGPPSALLARAIEALPSTLAGEAHLARLTVEIFGAVPVDELTVTAAVLRPGRSVELVEATAEAGGRTVLSARGWRIRRTELELPRPARPRLEPAPMRPSVASVFTDPAWRVGYLGAVEWRFISGHFEKPGPALVWARPRVPLVAGEAMSPVQRLVALADSGNGLSRVLDMAAWWFINTELSLHLHRPPAGDWMCVRARTTLSEGGTGLATTLLYDDGGAVGQGAQALLVGPRA
ncbi:thioesterase family protein [Asanoa sp. NPDC050611]|uniref:thioesterase family protein n=1 Tax=Asanoa sp. NPDC050611 TaxID=3157098 RepID=UPI0033C49415